MEITTGLDAKAKEDGAIRHIALFWPTEYLFREEFSSIGWAVTTKKSERNKGADLFKVILRPEYMRKLQDQKSPILSSPYLETGSSTMDCYKMGRPISSLSAPIRACEGKRRPRLLYRVVHEDHPGNGLHSRGFGTIKTDQISFMMHFYYHLNWKCRNASPFMSTTTDPVKVANLADWYEGNGFKNIEILVIKVDGSEWPSQSKIWNVTKTASKLYLNQVLMKPYYDYEYLIEDYIPASCVARIRWEEMKADITAETSKMRRSKKRKRGIFESDGPGDEVILNDEPGTRVWGVVRRECRRQRQSYYFRPFGF